MDKNNFDPGITSLLLQEVQLRGFIFALTIASREQVLLLKKDFFWRIHQILQAIQNVICLVMTVSDFHTPAIKEILKTFKTICKNF